MPATPPPPSGGYNLDIATAFQTGAMTSTTGASVGAPTLNIGAPAGGLNILTVLPWVLLAGIGAWLIFE
jgi:hypothetical protein